ncbi:CoA binding domain-containing protein [Bombardia bombarda]|uniref:CoA binding domain-containing protein n=1 Tax=Bombardia bombarda TaxID=252184 RepID=A0AA39XNT8_9PEZI|nr:CoA binding domain-containing protein [Bombardia bombarda]
MANQMHLLRQLPRRPAHVISLPKITSTVSSNLIPLPPLVPVSIPSRRRLRPSFTRNTTILCNQRNLTISTRTMAATDADMKTFFQSPNYAVVGASTNPSKFGHKIFKWYVTRDLPVTPINPIAKAIAVDDKEIPTAASLSELASPKETSVSFITAPPITLKGLKEAKELGIPAVWLQPGTYDDEVLGFARENFKAALAGEGGWGGEGWCVLVDGDRGLKSVSSL